MELLTVNLSSLTSFEPEIFDRECVNL